MRFIARESAVLTPCRCGFGVGIYIVLNQCYEDFSNHYCTAIMPAGVKKPKQKGDIKGKCYEFTADLDTDASIFTGWSNQKLIPTLADGVILEHIRKIQRSNQIKPSDKLEGRYNLTIEMETGVGKTYTYIKTMRGLQKSRMI